MSSVQPGAIPYRWTKIAGPCAFAALTVLGMLANRPFDYNFMSYVFGDIGASWHAIDLIRAGKLPGIDYVFQYGAFSIGIFQAALGVLGESPVGIYRFGVVSVVLLATCMYLFARRIGAPSAAWAVGACWVISTQRTNFLSSSHAIEPVLLAAAVLAGTSGRLPLALSLSVITWFVKPSMALIMATNFAVWIMLDSRDLRSIARNGLKVMLTVTMTGIICFGITVVWLGWASASSLLLPRQGTNVYKSLNFGFFRGQGSQIWHMPGATAGYYLGTQSASWLTINALLILLSLVIAVRWLRNWFRDHAFRDRLGELVVMLVAAHTAFVCFFYGLAWGWTYYAWLFWMAMMAGMTWLSLHCDRPKAVAGLSLALTGLSLLGNYADFDRATKVLPRYVAVESRYGLYGPPDLAEAWGKLRADIGDRPTLIGFMFGYGAGVLGQPFYAPPLWAMTPGDEFEPMLKAWKETIDRAELIVVGVEESMLAKFPEMDREIRSRFEPKDYGIEPPLKLTLFRRIGPRVEPERK
ncbi:hypothetical protein GC170_09460 [bacterium]|nr:hypothetical protein [bacterium]